MELKFSSCRGVSFEIKTSSKEQPNPSGRSVRLPSKVFPTTSLPRSTSVASSHFCDLNDDDDDNEVDAEVKLINDIEQQQIVAVAEQKPPETVGKISIAKTKQNSRLSIILLDQGLFTVYKRLFAVCFVSNMAMLALAIAGKFNYAKKRAALFAMANILVLTLCRSEAVLRVVFYLAVKLLGHPWVPLRIKTAATALLQSLGGIHSGCGVSSVAWLTYALILTLRHRDETSKLILASASAILGLLGFSCLAAFPLVRHLHHNAFERAHRFAGWSALALLWVFILLTVSYNSSTKSYNLKFSNLVTKQELWFTVSITFFTILPWLTVRKVPVSVAAPSTHASLITFTGGMKPGILGRISRSPLSEWHAFGIISDGKDNHRMLAGAVGDFTKGLVSSPPSHLWVRGVRFAGLPYLVNMYNRVVLVATGSGICVFLSFLLQPCAAEVCLIWVTKGVEQNFGREIKEMMSGHARERVIVHDTAVAGRPNVAEMTVEAARRWEAEVVVVTSNPQGSRDVVRACNKAGIAAFGPIWDS